MTGATSRGASRAFTNAGSRPLRKVAGSTRYNDRTGTWFVGDGEAAQALQVLESRNGTRLVGGKLALSGRR